MTSPEALEAVPTFANLTTYLKLYLVLFLQLIPLPAVVQEQIIPVVC